ncbi:MAG: topoisomerase, partial [Chloroflexota bacterium]|nr:topoisomerase [Chloroflexota bacterium]
PPDHPLKDLTPEEQSRRDATAAGLRFVSDRTPGVRRLRAGKGFRYVDPDGRAVRGREELARIAALVIPPAWTDVWICPHPRGHIQATGRDARGRKQYRYHERWREVRDADKFERMMAFGRALPRIRRRVARDLNRRGLPRERVLATVVRLLDQTLIRVGNEEYARENRSFGLTTLRNRHVDVKGAEVRFNFRGKSGKVHAIDVQDPRVARIIRRLQELPGQEVFQYLDDEGEVRRVDSDDVNEYLRAIAGDDFTAKDFRTWNGTVIAAEALQAMREVTSDAEAKRNVLRAIESVAGRLGNTVAVCRRCYVHPAVPEAYLDGTLAKMLKERADAEMARVDRLGSTEAAVLVLLRGRLARDAAR